MNLTFNLIINGYAILLLGVLCFHATKHADREAFDHKLYLMIAWVTVLMLILDILGRFDGNPGTLYPILNHFGNFLIFALNLLLPSLWLLYVYYQVYHDTQKMKRILYPLMAIGVANVIMVVLSQFFGWYYTIDAQNIYHRGPLYPLSASVAALLLIASCVLVLFSRKKIHKEHYSSLLFFAILPFAGIFLQLLIYGYSLTLISVIPSLIIVYLNIQSQSINTDYLTGINNRKGLEKYLKKKIEACSPTKTFSAIMLDLDDFKYINDTFGHDTGDTVLKVSTKLFRSCIRSKDFIARFGGDEFFIIMDISNQADLEATVNRINHSIAEYNLTATTIYKLGVSMGYAVYDFNAHLKIEQFQKKIDMMMYENKHKKQDLKSANTTDDIDDFM